MRNDIFRGSGQNYIFNGQSGNILKNVTIKENDNMLLACYQNIFLKMILAISLVFNSK